MLLPSAIQRSDDLVGMATPMVPPPALSPDSVPLALSSSPPQAARLRARLPAARVMSSLRTNVLHSLHVGPGRSRALSVTGRRLPAGPDRSSLHCRDVHH